SRFDERVKDGTTERDQRVVFSIVSPLERNPFRRIPDEGTRDDPADTEFVADFSRDLRDVVETLQSERLLVRGDLPDGIRARVKDRFSGRDVFVAEFFDDLGSGRGLVPEDARKPAFAHPTIHDLGGETFGIGLERFFDDETRHLPMTGSRVLASGEFARL